MAVAADSAGAILTIDLGALAANYRRLAEAIRPADAAAVVKADAYGLGVGLVVPALYAAGCQQFFVAHLGEALAVRPLLPQQVPVYVLNGLPAGCEPRAARHGITPVLNSLTQAARWQEVAEQLGRPLEAILQVDSGMARLGLSADDAEALAADAHFSHMVPLAYVMSHLACADEPGNDANDKQRRTFQDLARLFPGVPHSLANSGGCLLPARFHGDLARPGIALYGGSPQSGTTPPFQPVVRLEARIIQLRSIEDGDGVGYGLTWRAAGRRRLATISVGYADGWPRHLSNRGAAYWQGIRLPFAGRVSMDSIVLDISATPEGAIGEGDFVELLGEHQGIDAVASDAGTISYEILTNLGRRYARKVIPFVAGDAVVEQRL